MAHGARPREATIEARSPWAACRPLLMWVGLFSFCANLLMLAVPLYTLQIFDRVLTSRSTETLAMLTLIVVGALAVFGILEAVRSRILVRVSNWFQNTLSPVLFARAVEVAPLHPGSAADGLRDLSTLRGFLSGPGVVHLFDVPWVPIYVGVIVLIHPLLGAVAALGAVALGAMALFSELATRRALGAANAGYAAMLARADGHVRRAEAVGAMGMLPQLVADWQRQNRDVLRDHAAASDRAGLCASITRFLRPTLQVAILGVGAYLVLQRALTPGAMIAASIILSRALAPVEQMVGTWKAFVAARAANRRLNERLAAPMPVRSSTRMPDPEGRVDVERATVTAPGGLVPVLRHVQFSLAPGESLGVIGPSAAGKSSLARLLVGLWPATSGQARLDGVDLFTWDRADLGRHVGYLPQDVDLLDGPVRQVIARMDPGAEDAAVIAAAKLAGAHEMVLRLPLGYDTVIGRDRHQLSGGQRQRLGLARAFYGNPRLLVLDEPNANLDAEGERALIDALEQARALGITAIIIAHRPSVLVHVDKLLILRDGRMEMYGPRAEIMAQVAPQRSAAAGQRTAGAGVIGTAMNVASFQPKRAPGPAAEDAP
ncbi:type I secretion system permease/ATPase [Arenibaculum sp.]|uniref:type I secretion system permease/ATPase n=1 Tax=Arenibaculum sp. TaxID=2865862 RepID=UPI0039C8BA98